MVEKSDSFELMAKADPDGHEIVHDNTLLLFAPKTLGIPKLIVPSLVDGLSCYVFTPVIGKVNQFLDPYPDDGVWRSI